MRILGLNYEYTTTGSTLALLWLLDYWRASGHTVSVSAVESAEGPIKQQYRQRDIPVLDAPATGAFDVVICNTVLTAPQLLEWAGSAKTIWWIHEGSVGLRHLLQHPPQIAAFGAAAAVVFPIAHLRDAIYQSFVYDKDAARFTIIPYGIPAVGSAATTRRDANLIRIVSVGSIYPRKRHEDLIRAVSLCGGTPIKCQIAGKFFSLPDDCMSLIAGDPERYELTGELARDATLELVASADVFCLPSGSEVLPLTVLEAAMLEKPLILSDLSVYQGIWRHGHNCLTYPVGAIGLLAQLIGNLATNPDLSARLGAAARQTASRYTDGAFYARFDALLSSLCG
ncbi:MAG: glycosyltransferase family 4 protein [Alphaproteobacteria bacterium]|nr:glycosyltransferase family 4 protein [Alphaproteobacteria bacterium]